MQYLTRRPVDDYEACSWGVAPGNAIVVSSAMDMSERQAIQRYMKKAAIIYGNKTMPVRKNLPYENPEPQFDDNGYPLPANRDYDGETRTLKYIKYGLATYIYQFYGQQYHAH